LPAFRRKPNNQILHPPDRDAIVSSAFVSRTVTAARQSQPQQAGYADHLANFERHPWSAAASARLPSPERPETGMHAVSRRLHTITISFPTPDASR
jgi:hypothetical protein